MRRVLAITLRTMWTVVSYLVAVFCGGAVMALSTDSIWVPSSHSGIDSAAAMVETALIIGITGSFLGYTFFLPAMVGITAAEIFRVRSALSHLLGGVAVAALAGTFTDVLWRTHISHARAWEILLAAGVISGAVYWLLAGRNSGRWQDIDEASPRPIDNSKESSDTP